MTVWVTKVIISLEGNTLLAKFSLDFSCSQRYHSTIFV